LAEPAGNPRIWLSPPHMSGDEEALLLDAFRSGWIAPLGPHVDAFEAEFAEAVGAPHAVALSSGTAALHLALELVGVRPGDDVLVSTFTFVASVNPIRYLGATPVLVDSEPTSWNMDPELLDAELERRARAGRLPKAVVVVHLYGQSADMARITESCSRHGVPLVEDAAEALGATWGAPSGESRAPGTLGDLGIYSFNGNKIITTSGGGMLVTRSRAQADRARFLATQAREPAPHYEHTTAGYNYRLSNLLAAVGRGQLRVLNDRVAARRRVFEGYLARLGHLLGLAFQPEAPWGRHSRWLTCVRIDPALSGTNRDAVRVALEAANIEARPLWKPMHLQPLYRDVPCLNRGVAEAIFADGLCLPSGSALGDADLDRICEVIAGCVTG
jgi:dTDP-4-amino-4,6-dideoxygalactose transaminase